MKRINYILIFLGLNIPILKSQCLDQTYGCDTVTTNNNLSNYTEYYKQKSYQDAYQPWLCLIKNAPKRTKNLYLHGPKILKGLIEKTQDEIENIRYELGLNKPYYIQLLNFYTDLIKGDFGYSTIYQGNPIDAIIERLPFTILLTISAIIVTVILGISNLSKTLRVSKKSDVTKRTF